MTSRMLAQVYLSLCEAAGHLRCSEMEPILVPDGKCEAFGVAGEFICIYQHHINNGSLFPRRHGEKRPPAFSGRVKYSLFFLPQSFELFAGGDLAV